MGVEGSIINCFCSKNPPHAMHAFNLYQRTGSQVVMSVCQHGDDLMWRARGTDFGVKNDLKIGVLRWQ